MTPAFRVGIRPPHACFESDPSRLHAFVERAEDSGLDHLCVGDHVSFRNGRGYDGLIQATALATSSRLPVHTAVYLLALRHPVVVARQVASLAQLAPGRLVFGVGLGGDDPHELEVCGIDPSTRGRRMDESLIVLRGLLQGETVDHRGDEIVVRDARVLPAPSPRVPILVGGRSEAALRRAARACDGWLGLFVAPDRWTAARDRVDVVAAELGRAEEPMHHGLVAWCGFGHDRADAQQVLAPAMEALYETPFDRFARHAPAGTPQHVADALAPYVEAGCEILDLIPVAADDAVAIDGCATVRDLLGARVRT
jgi:alkanesulfonate monooxygenase SsuD/methylene tetrahydromethanopterin reductase-like flavin-dependent oxidoreductase (luciferase family)